jgi:hypothetical protein
MDRIAEIFRRAGWTPIPGRQAEFVIQEIERRIRGRLPRLFRQFLAYENAIKLLRHHSNADEPIPCADLGKRVQRWERYNPILDKRLPFMFENQGVCCWAIALDDPDDPRVFIEVDSGEPPHWQVTASAFTDWLSCQIEDSRGFEGPVFCAEAREIGEADLQLIRSSFEERHRTFAWPGKVNYRFSDEHMRLLLWSNDGQCDWTISRVKGASLRDFLASLNQLRGIPGLQDALYAASGEDAATLQTWKSG